GGGVGRRRLGRAASIADAARRCWLVMASPICCTRPLGSTSQPADGSIRSIRCWSPNLDAWLVGLDSSIAHRLTFYSWQVIVRSVILLLSNPAEHRAGCCAQISTGWESRLWRYERRPGIYITCSGRCACAAKATQSERSSRLAPEMLQVSFRFSRLSQY